MAQSPSLGDPVPAKIISVPLDGSEFESLFRPLEQCFRDVFQVRNFYCFPPSADGHAYVRGLADFQFLLVVPPRSLTGHGTHITLKVILYF